MLPELCWYHSDVCKSQIWRQNFSNLVKRCGIFLSVIFLAVRKIVWNCRWPLYSLFGETKKPFRSLHNRQQTSSWLFSDWTRGIISLVDIPRACGYSWVDWDALITRPARHRSNYFSFHNACELCDSLRSWKSLVKDAFIIVLYDLQVSNGTWPVWLLLRRLHCKHFVAKRWHRHEFLAAYTRLLV